MLKTSDRVISQEFINNFMERCFNGVTRPSINHEGGKCIDNIFIKSNNIALNAFKLPNPFNDLYPLIINIKQIEIKENEWT